MQSTNIIDVITVGGVRGQMDGFYRDSRDRFVAVSRVHRRVDHLLEIANGGPPGRFAQLLNYAQSLASRYFQSGPAGADVFAGLSLVGSTRVTGRGYARMADYYRDSPGVNLLKCGFRRSRCGWN